MISGRQRPRAPTIAMPDRVPGNEIGGRSRCRLPSETETNRDLTLNPRFARGFGGVHRRIGVIHQRIDLAAVVGIDGDADA